MNCVLKEGVNICVEFKAHLGDLGVSQGSKDMIDMIW